MTEIVNLYKSDVVLVVLARGSLFTANYFLFN